MAVLNITHNGISADVEIELTNVEDDDIRRVAVEVIRSGGVGDPIEDLPDNAFDNYVVDRLDDANREGEKRIYLRPKVPFGQAYFQIGWTQSEERLLANHRR